LKVDGVRQVPTCMKIRPFTVITGVICTCFYCLCSSKYAGSTCCTHVQYRGWLLGNTCPAACTLLCHAYVGRGTLLCCRDFGKTRCCTRTRCTGPVPSWGSPSRLSHAAPAAVAMCTADMLSCAPHGSFLILFGCRAAELHRCLQRCCQAAGSATCQLNAGLSTAQRTINRKHASTCCRGSCSCLLQHT
jgi:hypothetical protein